MRRAAPVLVWLIAACSDQRVAAPPPGPGSVAAVRDAGAAAAPADAGEPSRFVGVLTAAQSVDIAPRVAGVIAAVHVGAGDRVVAGQVVAEMDPAQMREELRAAEAAYNAATAAHKQATVDVDDARRKVALERRAVDSGVSPKATLDEAEFGVRRAEAAEQRARSTQAAEASRTRAARDHLADAGLRAPFAGTVANRYRDAGNRVEAGAPIVKLVGHGAMRLRFAVPPQLARLIAVGGEVTATIDTIATPVIGKIEHVSPALDAPSGMIFAEAELTTQNAELRPGLAALVRPGGPR